eukprot:TRINITY_DN4216_c0_g1_i1.p1 TRINITY_DN4216_c0_g1~~TRINITY_DN4216_c0_g1_i1.p1  ORF type:complete len:1237 (-),score=263.21 TRINITY_DN4216_c0_g1_i1:102-3764(-)
MVERFPFCRVALWAALIYSRIFVRSARLKVTSLRNFVTNASLLSAPAPKGSLCVKNGYIQQLCRESDPPKAWRRVMGFLGTMSNVERKPEALPYGESYGYSFEDALRGTDYILDSGSEFSNDALDLISNLMESDVQPSVHLLKRLYAGEVQARMPDRNACEMMDITCEPCVEGQETVAALDELAAVRAVGLRYNAKGAEEVGKYTKKATRLYVSARMQGKVRQAEGHACTIDEALELACRDDLNQGTNSTSVPDEQVQFCVSETIALYSLGSFVTGLWMQLHMGVKGSCVEGWTLQEQVLAHYADLKLFEDTAMINQVPLTPRTPRIPKSPRALQPSPLLQAAEEAAAVARKLAAQREAAALAAKKAREEAETKAAQEQKRLQSENEARQRAEERRKKEAAEEKRRKELLAAQEKQKQDALAAEAAKKAAAAEAARKAAEEAQAKAAEDKRLQSEKEAQRRAEERRKKEAEAEAARKAAEEAKAKALEEQKRLQSEKEAQQRAEERRKKEAAEEKRRQELHAAEEKRKQEALAAEAAKKAVEAEAAKKAAAEAQAKAAAEEERLRKEKEAQRAAEELRQKKEAEEKRRQEQLAKARNAAEEEERLRRERVQSKLKATSRPDIPKNAVKPATENKPNSEKVNEKKAEADREEKRRQERLAAEEEKRRQERLAAEERQKQKAQAGESVQPSKPEKKPEKSKLSITIPLPEPTQELDDLELSVPLKSEYETFIDLSKFDVDLHKIVETGKKVHWAMDGGPRFAAWLDSFAGEPYAQVTRFLHRDSSALPQRIKAPFYAGKPLQGTTVAIAGAGPGGLRLAIELLLMGARVHVMEGRRTFSRYNVLKLWKFSEVDLVEIGVRDLFSQLLVYKVKRVPIATMQHSLLRIALTVGADVHPSCKVKGLAGLESQPSLVMDQDCPTRAFLEDLKFDVLIDGTGTSAILRKLLPPGSSEPLIAAAPAKAQQEAIGITMNFQRFSSRAENAFATTSDPRFAKYNPATVDEFNMAYQFEISLFESKEVDLKNVVYWKSSTSHYCVVTVTREALYKYGVLDRPSNPKRWVPFDELVKNYEKLPELGLRIAEDWHFPHSSNDTSAFVINDKGRPDISMFEYGIRTSAEVSSRFLKGNVFFGIVGDAVETPFWPLGTGANHAIYSAYTQTLAILAYRKYGYSKEEATKVANDMNHAMLKLPGNYLGFEQRDYEEQIENNYNFIANHQAAKLKFW